MVNRIKEIVEEVIGEESSIFLVDVRLKGGAGNQKLLIIIDGDDGISIDHCTMISRKVGVVLEEEDLLEGKYNLEVSSPGLDHPITLKRQYVKNVGRHLEVEKNDGAIVRGKLLGVDSNTIILQSDEMGTEVPMNFEEISKSKIEVSFK